MRVFVFDQWEKLVERVRGIASASASSAARYPIARVEASGGSVRLSDRTVNVLSVGGGKTTVLMPEIEPGRARDFMLRVSASGENEMAFSGAEAFEGEGGALDPPGDGETVVYFFTETDADVLMVARKVAARLET